MKNVLKIVASVVLFVTLPASAAHITNADTTFELYNKDNEAIRISEFRVYGGSIEDLGFAANTLIQPKGVVRARIKVVDANQFLIYMEIKHGRGTYKYTIRPGHKTVFVSFTTDKSPALYRQTGPFKGWLGITESGLPLKNNLKAGDIVQGDTRTTREKIAAAFGTGF